MLRRNIGEQGADVSAGQSVDDASQKEHPQRSADPEHDVAQHRADERGEEDGPRRPNRSLSAPRKGAAAN